MSIKEKKRKIKKLCRAFRKDTKKDDSSILYDVLQKLKNKDYDGYKIITVSTFDESGSRYLMMNIEYKEYQIFDCDISGWGRDFTFSKVLNEDALDRLYNFLLDLFSTALIENEKLKAEMLK